VSARGLHRWLMLANIPAVIFTIAALVGGIFGLGNFDLTRILWMVSPLIVVLCLAISSHLANNDRVAVANVLAAIPPLSLCGVMLALR